MTPLRQRMIEDMQLRNLSSETQRAYVHYIKGLAQFYQTSPDQLGLEEIREYQLHLVEQHRLSPQSINTFVSAVKFLYTVTLETPWPEGALPRPRIPHKLPVVLSPVETNEFFQHVATIRYRAALMTAYGAGLRVSEVVALRLGDIDSQRKLIRIRQGKGKKDRYAMLSPRLLEVLRCWWRSAARARAAAQVLAGGLALSRLSSWPSYECQLAAGRVPRRSAAGRAEQASDRAHAAPQLRHSSSGERQ